MAESTYTDDSIEEQIEESILPPENIIALNEQRSASDLNRMVKSASIDIHPDFQREEVWNENDRTRFIDSLTKEFPIPSMCLALDPREQKFIVIDGLQRISTIYKFLSSPNWVLSKLGDIDKRIAGKSVEEIQRMYPEIYRKIENITLPITVLRYDPSKQNNMEFIFTIFQRLNTLGTKLNNQEIRNAIYQGAFNTFIRSCSNNEKWIKLHNLTGSKGLRMLEEERALRFFAFYEYSKKYDGKLNRFLNTYMQEKRFSDNNDLLGSIFTRTLDVASKLDISQDRKSNALVDAVLYGIANNIDSLESVNGTILSGYLIRLQKNEHFSTPELSEGVMKKQKVLDRLEASLKIFRD